MTLESYSLQPRHPTTFFVEILIFCFQSSFPAFNFDMFHWLSGWDQWRATLIFSLQLFSPLCSSPYFHLIFLFEIQPEGFTCYPNYFLDLAEIKKQYSGTLSMALSATSNTLLIYCREENHIVPPPPQSLSMQYYFKSYMLKETPAETTTSLVYHLHLGNHPAL